MNFGRFPPQFPPFSPLLNTNLYILAPGHSVPRERVRPIGIDPRGKVAASAALGAVALGSLVVRTAMDDSILAKFPDDDHVLRPFLGNLPPGVLDAVVRKLGWFRTAFALAGRTCLEAVDRVQSTRAVLTEEELEELSWAVVIPLAEAVIEGDVEAMVWLMQLFDEKGLEWRDGSGTDLSLLAAERGKIESLTCLRANGCPWGEGTCANAAYEGHLEVLQWARQNGCPWGEGTCADAAEGGHLEVLQWAHQNGCPWDKWTCTYAAREGHLEVLQWARQNGCPWDERTWAFAHTRCRPYLFEYGCPGAR